MYDICSAVLAINPDAKILVRGEGTENEKITWNNGTPVISKSDIQAKQAELKTAYDAKEYQRKRAEEYPAIVDQLDDIYHNGIDGWKTQLK